MQFKHPAAIITLCLLGGLLGAAPPADPVIDKPAYGKPAPEIAVTDLSGKPVTLASLRGKPVVLEFASLTEPVVRLHSKEVEVLALKWQARVTFLLIYQKEAHASGTENALALNVADGFAAAEPVNQDERTTLALELQDKLGIHNVRIAVDQWSNATSQTYGSLPNMTFLLDEKGNLAAAYPWMDTKKLQGAISNVLDGKPVADANMGPARTRQQPLTVPDNLGNQGPGAGVVSAAIALDGMTLSDQQRAAVLKPLANYVAALRNLQAKNQAAAAGAATTGGPAAPADRQTEIEKVAQGAADLKAILKQQLKPDDYQKMVDALSQGVGKQFFAQAN